MIHAPHDTLFDLEYFFELSPDWLCIAGYDGYFKKINSAVSKSLGYTQDELFASPINSFVHPHDQAITSKKRQNLAEGEPLLNFENRYLTKNGDTIWLSWTSIPVEGDRIFFAIAKVLVYKQKLEEYWRIANHLEINQTKKQSYNDSNIHSATDLLPEDVAWLNELEKTIRKYIGKLELTNHLLSNELMMSERQLFRRIKSTLGITPNKFVQVVRFKLASEAIVTGKYTTLAEISNIAGFDTPAYFSKLFTKIYGVNVLDILHRGYHESA